MGLRVKPEAFSRLIDLTTTSQEDQKRLKTILKIYFKKNKKEFINEFFLATITMLATRSALT